MFSFWNVVSTLSQLFFSNFKVDISHYPTKAIALCHSMELACLTPPWCASTIMSLLSSWALKSISFHFILFGNLVLIISQGGKLIICIQNLPLIHLKTRI